MHFKMDNPGDLLDTFLAQPGRRRWDDAVRRALVVRIMGEKEYGDPSQVRREDFGKYATAYRVKRFRQDHATMITALFPEAGLTKAIKQESGGELVVVDAAPKAATTETLGDRWLWVVVVNTVVFLLAHNFLSALIAVLSHFQQWLIMYVIMGNLVVARSPVFELKFPPWVQGYVQSLLDRAIDPKRCEEWFR